MRNALKNAPMTALTILALILAVSKGEKAQAAYDGQAWGGVGLGFVVWTKGTGAGVNLRGEGGYNFTKEFGLGLHTDYSKIGSVNIKMLNYGGFLQLQDPGTSFYGRLYLDGTTGIAPDDQTSSGGLKGSETAFTPGIGLGLLIPASGDFHMVPEVSYKLGLFTSIVHIVSGTFNLVWDF